MITFKYTKAQGWGQMIYFITFEEANDNEIQITTND